MAAPLKQVPWHNIPKLIQSLEKKLPESIVVLQWIKTHLEWRENTPGLDVKILTVDGDWKDGSVACVADGIVGSNNMYGVIYATAEKAEEFKSAAKTSKLVDWNRVKRLSSVLQRNTQMVVEILEFQGCKPFNVVEGECYLHYISAEEAAQFKLPDLPENVRVGPLEEQHLQILCDNWRHYDPDYKPVNLHLIKHNATVGVFEKNEQGEEILASMVLHCEYGAVGLLQTLPEYRRKGYAAIALAHISRIMGQNGYMPYGTVLTFNEMSSQLFKKFGFKQLEGVTTFICITPFKQ
ncbi:uncharacterized protein LOC135945708 [Cloeon dipterum]|uniref:uncharacterized protein LOC135945708 n=1 Tax=Cloeon dipterum TaxID=197152 RepID=UPI0032206A5C